MQIETRTAVVSLHEGIVVARHKKDSLISAEAVAAIFDAEQKLTKNKKHGILIDLRGFVNVTEGAMKTSASGEPAKYRKAAAFLIDSKAVQIQMQCYLDFAKPKVPAKVFFDEAKALEWLRSV